MQQPKLNIKNLVAFVIVCLGLLMLLNYAFVNGAKRVNTSTIGKINKLFNHQINEDVVFFGSSSCETGFNTQLFKKLSGKTAYNFGLNGTTFRQYSNLITEFCNYNKNTKIVVLSEAYQTFADAELLTEPNDYLAHINNPLVYDMLYSFSPKLAWRSKYIPGYSLTQYNTKFLKNSFLGWKNCLNKNQVEDSLNGFLPQYKYWQASQDKILKEKSITIVINEKVKQDYINKIKLLQENGKTVVIVLTPIQALAYNNSFKNMELLKATFNSISALTGAKFIDYSNSPISNNKQLFYNFTHVNKSGADSLTTLLYNDFKSKMEFN